MTTPLAPPPKKADIRFDDWITRLWKRLTSTTSGELGLGTMADQDADSVAITGGAVSADLTGSTGLPISTGVSGLGTGIATALAVNTGSAGAPVLFSGALGTPSSGTVTNLTGTASININGTVGATTPTTGAFTTLTTSSTITASGAVTGTRFIPSGSTVPTNGLYLPAANTIGWATNSTERMRIDSSGPLLYGTTTWPTTNLGKSGARTLIGNEGILTLWNETASVGGAAVLYLGTKHSTVSTGMGGASISGGTSSTDYSGFLGFSTYTSAGALTERMRIDSNGNVIVGHSSALSPGAYDPKFQVVGTTYKASLSISRFSNDTGGPHLLLSKSRGTTAGSYTVVQSGDDVGTIRWTAADGTDDVSTVALITVQIDGTPGANDVPGRIIFSTTADGASNVTERMRINSSGNVLVGVTSATTNGGKIETSNGITFPATQSACSNANTLDDYEEGSSTNTVTVEGTTTAGTVSYSARYLFYTKIGNRVFFNINVTWSSLTGTGNLKITGLPYTASSSAGSYSECVVSASNLTFSGHPTAEVSTGGTSLLINSTVSGSALAGVPVDADGALYISGSYTAA